MVTAMKLPKPRQRGNSWSTSIMINGKREYCTRDTEQECIHWARLCSNGDSAFNWFWEKRRV